MDEQNNTMGQYVEMDRYVLNNRIGHWGEYYTVCYVMI